MDARGTWRLSHDDLPHAVEPHLASSAAASVCYVCRKEPVCTAVGTTHCLQVEASRNAFNLTLQLSGVPNCVALPVVLRGST